MKDCVTINFTHNHRLALTGVNNVHPHDLLTVSSPQTTPSFQWGARQLYFPHFRGHTTDKQPYIIILGQYVYIILSIRPRWA